MIQKRLSATWLLEVLLFMFVYVALTVAWFGFAAPEMVSSPSTGAVLVGFAGSALWLICTTCIVVHIINKWHSAKTTEKQP
ncbi:MULTISPECIES: hypothetical protein [Pseudomonas]|uniref:hypothetical protein n=1 Tax=Pseudomonas TaxID=286 RepID=UPI001BE76272|nr:MULTISPECIES: hypothetical protein [Pseudomonas]MBT2339491.1 hypothetical protein [Pseudomonas fluorescens]MCD4528655.1 hypothetical protein [Pseudomonas sp. C3-2018]